MLHAGVESSYLYGPKNWLMRQGAWKTGSYLLFTLVFLLGRGVRSQGWSGLLTHLWGNIYTVL
jgi:hypothetical protein